MSNGIEGPTVTTIPLASGKELVMKDATNVAGVVCEIHGLTPKDVHGIFLELVARPGGFNACRDCLLALTKYQKTLKEGCGG